jgi:hypothetical protein
MSAVDPRVAARGGTRNSPKSGYDYPGMIDAASWSRTQVAKATACYGCAWCGQTFSGPHAVYTDLDKRHPRRRPQNARKAGA